MHDYRYSLDFSRMRNMGWKPEYSFEQALHETIEWYKSNTAWWPKLKKG
jgi:dTDP-D-glucose 4,6-dehydratase